MQPQKKTKQKKQKTKQSKPQFWDKSNPLKDGLKEKVIKGTSIKVNSYQIPSMQIFVLDG